MGIPSIHPEQDHRSILLQPSSCVSKLENLALWFSKRQNKEIPDPIQAVTVLFAADHGVAHSIEYQPAASTVERIRDASASESVIAELCRQSGNSLHIVDVGVKECLADIDVVEHAKVRSSGTADITVESAMSQADYWEVAGIGEEMANRTIAAGANLLIAGSIAAGDHISIAAIISELVGLSPEQALRSDPDSTSETYARELMAVEKAIARAVGTPSHDVLRELGGLEMPAMWVMMRDTVMSWKTWGWIRWWNSSTVSVKAGSQR